ncbi:major histocompatibility complex class I-related gene protein-like isoform X2 [Phyllopteryx taeniolatus]|uniref:major histocompatibility complex class I-related gene protein-like isoform X2 n=1 Tax=Phyllopteryx taeniolatus TaxID=161469 RepID=UPI002AD2A8A6|nr:major histocompatibility complex class I-related gene protein-like isoform X2 [Phyllopteryx taeniolatus]
MQPAPTKCPEDNAIDVTARGLVKMKNKILTLLLALDVWSVEDTSAARHSLKYFLTATSGVQNFPEFVGAAEVDGVRVGYCDSNIQSAEPKQDWMKKLVQDDPQHLDWYKVKCFGNQNVFRSKLEALSRRLNRSGGSHVLQRMNGCEIDDDSGEVTGYNQYGYDGEDFIVLNLQTLTWTAPSPQAFTTKLIWDAETERLEYNKYYYIHKCPQWLKKYMHYGKSVLQRKELPSMALLQKTPSSLVCCHATGFYPDLAMLFWRRGGEELHEHVEHGEILPNHDGTFQTSVNINVSAVPLDERAEYECVFQLDGVKEQLVIKLDKDAIRTNWVPPPKFEIIGSIVVALLFLLVVAVTGYCIWKRTVYCRRRRPESEFQAVNAGGEFAPPPIPIQRSRL